MWCRLDTRTTFSSVIKKHICYSWFEPGSSMTTLISPRSMRRNKHSLTMPCVIEVQCSAIRIAWICTNLSSRHLSWTRYQTLHGIKLDEWSDTVTWVSGYLRFGVNYVNTQAPWSHLQDYVASCECAVSCDGLLVVSSWNKIANISPLELAMVLYRDMASFAMGIDRSESHVWTANIIYLWCWQYRMRQQLFLSFIFMMDQSYHNLTIHLSIFGSTNSA